MLKTTTGRLRVIGWFEGASYLLLLGVAMPLKYGFDMPQMVSIVGRAHGFLFILYVAAAVHAWIDQDWPIKNILFAAVASVLPFGPFVFDKFVLDKEQAEPAAEPDSAEA